LLRRQAHADPVQSWLFDSTLRLARQGGALHKTVAGSAESAYFALSGWRGPASEKATGAYGGVLADAGKYHPVTAETDH
jgi:hypothetical protein